MIIGEILAVAFETLGEQFIKKVGDFKILLSTCVQGICSAELQARIFGIFSCQLVEKTQLSRVSYRECILTLPAFAGAVL